MRKLGMLTTGLLLASCTLAAGPKTMMHCFAFTVIDGASDTDWKAWGAATDAWPKKMKVIKRVWHGKLRGPLTVYAPDAATGKKMNAQTKQVEGTFTRLRRQHGVCMEFTKVGPEVLKEYAAHPYHAEWMKLYEKVRVAGTTTYDILGE